MNIVEWALHKFIFGVIFAILLANGMILFLWGPEDNQLVYFMWVGITCVLVYYATYIFTKAFFWGGSRVNT